MALVGNAQYLRTGLDLGGAEGIILVLDSEGQIGTGSHPRLQFVADRTRQFQQGPTFVSRAQKALVGYSLLIKAQNIKGCGPGIQQSNGGVIAGPRRQLSQRAGEYIRLQFIGYCLLRQLR